MGKSSRPPILAAGGIVIRNGGKLLIAVVQRRRDGAWVLPKGKLKPKSRSLGATRSDQETGSDVRVHEFLGVISYVGGSGPKIAHFWRMQAVGEANATHSDIKAVDWLPLAAAVERLSLPHEQMFLRNVGRHALKRALKKSHIKLPEQDALHPMVDVVTAVRPAEVATRPRRETQPRWSVLARLKRLQAAIGRAGWSG